jgi:hypothetical protein
MVKKISNNKQNNNMFTVKSVAFIYLTVIVSAIVCAALTLLVTPSVEHQVQSAVAAYHYSYDEPSIINNIHDTTIIHSIAATQNSTDPNSEYCDTAQTKKKKKKLTVFLLAFFTGSWGVDRFYTGYVAQGVFKILTLGGLGIWNLVDWIRVLTGKRHEKSGCAFYDNL